jgi:hypothetical protein
MGIFNMNIIMGVSLLAWALYAPGPQLLVAGCAAVLIARGIRELSEESNI